MSYYITTIAADGTTTVQASLAPSALTTTSGKPSRLKQSALDKVQELINTGLEGGYMQIVPAFDTYGNKPCLVFCDEEGKGKGLPTNSKATYLWYGCLAPRPFVPDTLHGPVVIITADDDADLQSL